jgi:hypothetical protein
MASSTAWSSPEAVSCIPAVVSLAPKANSMEKPSPRSTPAPGREKKSPGSAALSRASTASRGPSSGGDQLSGMSRTESNPAARIR